MTSYASSLNFCLSAAGVPDDLCQIEFIDCLTTLPFGRTYLELAPGAPGRFLPTGPSVDTFEGIDFALKMLGWSAFEWHSSADQSDAEAAEEAVSIVEEGFERFGPVLIGPLDVSLLPGPGTRRLFSDYSYYIGQSPAGEPMFEYHPFSWPDLLPAWRAEGMEGRRGSYGLRARFEPRDCVTRTTAIARAVPLIRSKLTINPAGERYFGERSPRVWAGADALRLLAHDLAAYPLNELMGTTFDVYTFDTAANHCQFATRFLGEAVKPKAAENLAEQRAAYGKLAFLLESAIAPINNGAKWSGEEAAQAALRLADLEARLPGDLR